MLMWLMAANLLAAGPVLQATDYGVVANGTTDDGPALGRAMAALNAAEPGASLVLPTGRTLRIATSPTTWVIELVGRRDLTVDGGGCTLLLAPHLRLAHIRGCTNVTLRGLNLDYDPLPFADGLVVGADAKAGWVDVRVDDAFPMPAFGGPTGDREQAYFAMLWHRGPHSLVHEHFFVRDCVDAGPGALAKRIVRVYREPRADWSRIKPGETRISLPVRGIAHRMVGFGASPVVAIEENTDVLCESLNLWSGPLFGCNVARNRGRVTFRQVDLRPRPGTSRLTSIWRDGFHVKANYADLTFEDCHIEGTNDDAFNLATHSSRVDEAVSPTEIRIHQTFPLGFVPFEPGDLVGGYSCGLGRRFEAVRVVRCVEEQPRDTTNLNRPATPLRLTLDRPLPDVARGDVVWNQSSANPHTVIRRCVILNACRFQSPVTVEDSDITALAWFYGDQLEGPLPSDIIIRRCRLRIGRGNPELAASFECNIEGRDGQRAPAKEPVIANIRLEDNEIDGRLSLSDCRNVILAHNRFVAPAGALSLRGCRTVSLLFNHMGGDPLDRLEQIGFGDVATRGFVRFGMD
ncbi:MAG: hypothetical protein HZB16_20700 [Armatimonadetes bacterium]|nr:hypothetical protein [Armatimonadota bacterium]